LIAIRGVTAPEIAIKPREPCGLPRHAALQAQVRQLVADSHPGLALFNDQGVRAVLDTNPERIDFAARHSMEYVFSATTWFDLYKPVIQF